MRCNSTSSARTRNGGWMNDVIYSTSHALQLQTEAFFYFWYKMISFVSFQGDTSGDYKKCLLALATQWDGSSVMSFGCNFSFASAYYEPSKSYLHFASSIRCLYFKYVSFYIIYWHTHTYIYIWYILVWCFWITLLYLCAVLCILVFQSTSTSYTNMRAYPKVSGLSW
jgi:hypothetical protein